MHFAVVGTINDVVLYMNGVEKGRGVRAGPFPNPTNPLRVGDFTDYNNNGGYVGYMDEVRISKGIARWTSDFTPPNAYYYWNWSCNGLNGGSSVSCGADRY